MLRTAIMALPAMAVPSIIHTRIAIFIMRLSFRLAPEFATCGRRIDLEQRKDDLRHRPHRFGGSMATSSVAVAGLRDDGGARPGRSQQPVGFRQGYGRAEQEALRFV